MLQSAEIVKIIL